MAMKLIIPPESGLFIILMCMILTGTPTIHPAWVSIGDLDSEDFMEVCIPTGIILTLADGMIHGILMVAGVDIIPTGADITVEVIGAAATGVADMAEDLIVTATAIMACKTIQEEVVPMLFAIVASEVEHLVPLRWAYSPETEECQGMQGTVPPEHQMPQLMEG